MVYSPYTICEILCFLLEYGLWKLQLESWNINHELLNSTLTLVLDNVNRGSREISKNNTNNEVFLFSLE